MSLQSRTTVKNDLASAMPRTGEVWYGYLDPILGHEQGGNRPVVVVSANSFNSATGSRLVIVVPLTTTKKPYTTHILVEANKANLRADSWAYVRASQFGQFRAIQKETR